MTLFVTAVPISSLSTWVGPGRLREIKNKLVEHRSDLVVARRGGCRGRRCHVGRVGERLLQLLLLLPVLGATVLEPHLGNGI